MKTKIIFSPQCLEYGLPYHPENAPRIETAARILKSKGYDFIEPDAAKDEDIFLVHDGGYVSGVKDGTISDPDTPSYENIYEYACLAAGAAINAAKTGGFSLMRPPGHHAGISGRAIGAFTRGFCYFNNLAIAVRAQGKVAVIIDIDGHHGNGTQEIFSGDFKITYISLHRNNVFPGTGQVWGGNCRNYPLDADCGGKVYLETFKIALDDSRMELKNAQLIGVSAGFDAHLGDLASLGLRGDDYFMVGAEIAKLARPTFFVLEGGYNGANVGNDIDFLLRGFEGMD